MSFQSFINAYLEAMFWSEVILDDDCNELGFFEDHYSPEDLDPESMARVKADCRRFYIDWVGNWTDAGASDTQAGHDLFLTRNRHGTGFWDRPEVYGESLADTLSEVAQGFGTQHLYQGDEGEILVCE